MNGLKILVLLGLTFGCCAQPKVYVLGTAQDGGYPQMGCERSCCLSTLANDSLEQYVVSLALVDPEQKKWWLFEATPDIKQQIAMFGKLTNHRYKVLPDGIFITHAHIGHYTGLMQLGREIIGSKDIPVFVLPKFKLFLESNGPWSQLVELKNISLVELQTDKSLFLSGEISVTVLQVPHRDEYSETAGFRIQTKRRNYLFIPDIDKWWKWKKDIVEEVKSVDIAFLDATFYDEGELPDRSISEVPHPLVTETMVLFQNESIGTKRKVNFIHFNHTNPILFDKVIQDRVQKLGFSIARQKNEY